MHFVKARQKRYQTANDRTGKTMQSDFSLKKKQKNKKRTEREYYEDLLFTAPGESANAAVQACKSIQPLGIWMQCSRL